MKTIYLDYNATTPLAPQVQEAMLPIMAEHFGNPSSGHSIGRAAREAVEDARFRVAQALGAESDEILFTGCGTESNNLALIGTLRAAGRMKESPGRGHLVLSALEHPASVEAARFLESEGYSVSVIPCDGQGVVDPATVADAILPETVLVSVMLANNEIGTIQPVREIAELCRERRVLFHTDAAQAVGKIAVRVDELGVDLLTVAGHKVYAPKGIGVLYVRRGTVIDPLMLGGGQESGMRGGTENVLSIVALGRAMSLATESLSESSVRMARLRDHLLESLREGVGEQLSVNGELAPRLPNTLSVNFPMVEGESLLRLVPEICASTGAACHSGTARMSATLAAIGLDEATACGTVRLSLGWFTTEEEIDRAAGLLLGAWEKLREGS